ncbi:hypothetical protein C2S51_037921 [Perilla frutescens var. frutescens]|nr:hypothetical protein C2S51_037921 [Perilla frutescens var. frutescens]
MSAEETILNLFDKNWFEKKVFTSKPSLSTPQNTRFLQEKDEETAADDDHKQPKLNRITTLMRKSYSDQFLSSKDCSSESPNSVLGPHLQTILSGKEVESFEDSSPKEEKVSIDIEVDVDSDKNIHDTEDPKLGLCSKPERRRTRRRRRKSGTRSLSELEFEELKGFMDLGFVFSDEDKDSRLVSIIPGLQRLGKNVQESDINVNGFDETSVSRPYLSEAWDRVEDEDRVKNPLMEWRIPAFGNEMELKHHLKFWAHSVASTVR